MSELSLPGCPICYAEDSLSCERMERSGQSFVWYECQECGSVLLSIGDDQWAYQKVGREARAYLLKRPMTGEDLRELLPSIEEAPSTVSAAEVQSDTQASQRSEVPIRISGQRGRPTGLLVRGVAVAAFILIIGMVVLLGSAAGWFRGAVLLGRPTHTATPAPARFSIGDEVVVPFKKGADLWSLTEDGSASKYVTWLSAETRPEVVQIADHVAHGGEWYCLIPTSRGLGWIKEQELMTPAEHDRYLTEYFNAREKDINASRATADAGERELYGSLVEYYVDGTAGLVSITMENEAGGTEQFDYGTPYSTSFRRRAGFLYISAQNQGDSGSVTCRITVDGVLIQEATSQGAYVIATCSGSVP